MTTSPLLITHHPFIADMDEQHAHVLLHGAAERQFQPGQVIFREGDPANSFYLIESGEIVVELKASNRTIHIDTLGAGDVLGWSWLFPPFAWHFQARVVQPTQAICCDGAHLLVMSEEDHEFGYELMKRVSRVVIHRLQSTRHRLAQLDSIVPAANVAVRR